MENQLLNINFRTTAYTPRNEVLEGVNYLVVPVIMMQDGVHSGSDGALYHSIEELGRPDWNNIPVVINHPQVGNEFVSANSESVQNTDRVGIIRNTNVVGSQLKAEAWLDVTKMAAYQPDLLHRITGGEIINVSVGVFTDTIASASHPGTLEAVNHVPDHLAILPNDTGACSIADGCGIRVNINDKKIKKIVINNTKGGKHMTKEGILKELLTYKKNDLSTNELHELILALKPLDLGPISTNVCEECLQTNEASVLETVNLVRRHLDSMDNSEATYYLEDMRKDNTIVYRVDTRNSRRRESLYQQNYTVNEAGAVIFNGEPIPVKRSVTYEHIVNVNTMVRTKFNTNNEKEVTKMPKVNELATGLIANVGTSYVEEDRKWLETLSEEQLNKMVPKEVEVKEVVQTNAVDLLSAEEKSALEFGKQQLKAHRDNLVQKITANTAEGVWTPEALAKMTNDTLDRIAKSVKVDEGSVYVNGGSPEITTNASAEEAMYPAGIEMEKE